MLQYTTKSLLSFIIIILQYTMCVYIYIYIYTLWITIILHMSYHLYWKQWNSGVLNFGPPNPAKIWVKFGKKKIPNLFISPISKTDDLNMWNDVKFLVYPCWYWAFIHYKFIICHCYILLWCHIMWYHVISLASLLSRSRGRDIDHMEDQVGLRVAMRFPRNIKIWDEEFTSLMRIQTTKHKDFSLGTKWLEFERWIVQSLKMFFHVFSAFASQNCNGRFKSDLAQHKVPTCNSGWINDPPLCQGKSYVKCSHFCQRNHLSAALSAA